MANNKFVRNDTDKQQRQYFSLAASFKCAVSGLAYILKTQRNIKIHLVIALLVILLGFAVSLPPNSWVAVLICIGIVFVAEAINTAIETVVDLVSPEYNMLAKRAKDCAAAGVLLAAILSVAVGFVVFLPSLAALFL